MDFLLTMTSIVCASMIIMMPILIIFIILRIKFEWHWLELVVNFLFGTIIILIIAGLFLMAALVIAGIFVEVAS